MHIFKNNNNNNNINNDKNSFSIFGTHLQYIIFSQKIKHKL
jgi:hypothetical protein